jgi:serine/threonine protein kinase/tetratricopeptide (TPR) repeat protein
MPIDFQRIQGVFQEVAELPTPERTAALERECGGNVELRRQVEALLNAHDDSGELPAAEPVPPSWPTRPPTSDESPAAEQKPTEAYVQPIGPGHIFAGRYKLLQQIGEGGMGTVWMADQTDPVKRRVAVKLIRVERGQSKTILSRFEAERQAIALMDHPHIARLLDAGEAPPSQAGGAPTPFFVMELVKGLPLTDFCDAHKLGIPERLQLFTQVCAAVQHAHQKGIIHRDLKPSNILVESHDGKPVPKIIDFGLAKATSGLRLTENTLFTAFGSMMGTPLYMAPEQANFNALDVDTRADIYALGIILYELLTGSTPITRATLKKAALDEMLKLIREQEIPTPSSRLSSADSTPSVAANRQTEPAKLGRLVKGELDWIVLKSLAKERDRRYETAVGFAKDIERFLNHEPVRAGPPSAGYRLRKFARRNRGSVIAAGLVLLALVIGITGTTWGLLRAVAERDAKDAALKAEQQARADETEARQQAFAALRSMTDDVVERKFAEGTVLTEDDRAFLRGVIAQFDAFAAITGDDADSRALRAEGRFRVGRMRYRLSELKEAEQAFDQAVSLQEQLTADFPARPEFRQDLVQSHFHRGYLLFLSRRLKEAERDFNQALSLQKQLADFPSRPEFRNDLAHNLRALGVLMRNTGRQKEAEQDYDQALSILRQLVADFPARPEFRQELARCLANRALLLRETARLREAEKDWNDALSLQKQLAADVPQQPDLQSEVARTCVDLAVLHEQQGNWAAAKRLLLEARPHHLAALKANPLHPYYRAFYRLYLITLTALHAGLLEQEDAIRTAETCRDLGWNAPADAYDAACYLSRCVPIVAKHDKLDDKQRQEAAQFYSDAAMQMLRDAVSKGFKDMALMKKDTDLDPLREREDFKKLVAELEGKGE